MEIPLDRVIMAFFFSPDSTKLLCLATKVCAGHSLGHPTRFPICMMTRPVDNVLPIR